MKKLYYPNYLTICFNNAKKFAGILFLFFTLNAYGQTFTEGFTNVLIDSSFNAPFEMVFTPDGRLFIAEGDNTIQIVKNQQKLSKPLIKINGQLESFALHPGFNVNGYIYIFYDKKISRFTVQGDQVVSGSEKLILELEFNDCAGVSLDFGKDGKLYIALGFDGAYDAPETLFKMFGKLLRINDDGTTPSDNPYPKNSAKKNKLWALGLWEVTDLAIDQQSGKIYVNEGPYDYWKILDASTPGKNFGMSYEPASADEDFETEIISQPILAYGPDYADDYDQLPKNWGILKGCFFSPASTNYPAQYKEGYFFSDKKGWMKSMKGDNILEFSPGAQAIVIQTGPDGNLYYLTNKALYKVTYVSSVKPMILTQPAGGDISQGGTVALQVSCAGELPLSYQWRRYDKDIPGATSSSFSINNACIDHVGLYSVVVRNKHGEVISKKIPVNVYCEGGDPSGFDFVNGLEYTYYEGNWDSLPEFAYLDPVKTGFVKNYDLSPRNRDDRFGFKFYGYIKVPKDGYYVFFLNSDDGSNLYINETLVVDNNKTHVARTHSGTIGLKAGLHYISIDYFEKYAKQTLSLSYKAPGMSDRIVVPDSVLFRIDYSAYESRELLVKNANSNEVEIKLKEPEIFPLPAIDFLNVHFKAPVGEIVDFILIDGNGKKIHFKKNIIEGENKKVFDVSSLPKGIYVFQILGKSINKKTVVAIDK